MKQFRANQFLLMMMVGSLAGISALILFFFLTLQPIVYIMIGLLGLLGIIGIGFGFVTAFVGAFVVSLFYGLVVIISGTTDWMAPVGISYVLLMMPVTVAIVTGGAGHLNHKYLKVSESFEENYQALVRIDELTGFRNEIDYYDNLSEEINRKIRYGNTLTVMLLHIESFESLNQLYGERQGDRFLKYLSEFVIDLTRNVDKHYRIDDDLFALILPNTDYDGAGILKQRFMTELETTSIIVQDSNQIVQIEMEIVFDEYIEGMSPKSFHNQLLEQLSLESRGVHV